MNGVDYIKAADYGCAFEREMFHKSVTKVWPPLLVGPRVRSY